jgi:hypothetical protein
MNNFEAKALQDQEEQRQLHGPQETFFETEAQQDALSRKSPEILHEELKQEIANGLGRTGLYVESVSGISETLLKDAENITGSEGEEIAQRIENLQERSRGALEKYRAAVAVVMLAASSYAQAESVPNQSGRQVALKPAEVVSILPSENVNKIDSEKAPQSTETIAYKEVHLIENSHKEILPKQNVERSDSSTSDLSERFSARELGRIQHISESKNYEHLFLYKQGRNGQLELVTESKGGEDSGSIDMEVVLRAAKKTKGEIYFCHTHPVEGLTDFGLSKETIKKIQSGEKFSILQPLSVGDLLTYSTAYSELEKNGLNGGRFKECVVDGEGVWEFSFQKGSSISEKFQRYNDDFNRTFFESRDKDSAMRFFATVGSGNEEALSEKEKQEWRQFNAQHPEIGRSIEEYTTIVKSFYSEDLTDVFPQENIRAMEDWAGRHGLSLRYMPFPKSITGHKQI